MSNANPVDRKQFPLGRTLFVGGLIAIVLVIAMMFYRLYDGTRSTFGTITTAAPTVIDLPSKGEFILTRAEGISEDRSLTVLIETTTPNGTSTTNTSFVADDNSGYVTLNSKTNQILGQFTAPAAGPVTITANAAAYPLVVRRNPIAWAISSAKLAAVLGTGAAAVTAIGAFIAIRRYNEKQRRATNAFRQLIEDPH